MLIRFLLFCVLYGISFLQAQKARNTIRFENLTIEDGLSMSTIMDMHQSRNGYVWVATPEGLNLYNGYSFKVFKNIPGDEFSLSDNYVTAVHEDSLGLIWVGTFKGEINILNTQTGKFSRFEAFKNYNQKEYPIQDIEVDVFGNVWIATLGGGIACYKNNDKRFVFWNTETESIFNDRILTLSCDGKGKLWFGTENGMSFIENWFSDEKIWLDGNVVYNILIDKIGFYVATGDNGLFRMEGGEMVTVPISDNPEEFFSLQTLLSDNQGNLWIGSAFNGIAVIMKNGNIQKHITNPYERNSLINNIVYSSFKDNFGNLWFGTISGISIFKPLNQQFLLYRNSAFDPFSLSDNNVYKIFEDSKKNIWIGTLEGGLNKFDPVSTTFEIYNIDNCKGLSSNSIRCIFENSKGEYWIGTGDRGLFRFYPDERRFVAVNGKKGKTISSNYIRHIFEDKQGNIWLSTLNGLNFYDIQADTFASYVFDKENSNNNSFYEVLPDRDPSRFFVATFGSGLLVFDTKARKFIENYQHNSINPNSLSNNNILCINELNRDTLLIGTFGGGLNIYNRKNKTFSAITQREGLANDAIYGILVDKKKNIWMSTNKGLSRYNLYTGKIKNYDQINQVQSLEFNEGAFCKASNGVFYFGGINGINVFQPEWIKENKIVPQVHISGVKVFENELPFLQMLNKENKLKLRYNQNFISFDFEAISLVDVENTMYAFKLDGIDEDWVITKNRNFAKYTNIPPGEYTFQVKAANEDGYWNNAGASITIIITPPFWKTWWFISFAVFSIAGLTLLFFNYRTKIIKRSYQLKMSEVELKALRSQMNPHFIFNSINSIQYYILNKNPQTAYSYLSKFSALMRMILQNSRINFISIEDEIESLRLYLELENIRLDNELQYVFDIDKEVKVATTYIPSMVLQPYVENSIIHGLLNKDGEKKVSIRIKQLEKHLFCEIEDNGIGREKAKELNEKRTKKHESTAMKATMERLEILNRNSDVKLSVEVEDLKDINGMALGTKVNIYIPFTDKKS